MSSQQIHFDIRHGFLPANDPLTVLPEAFSDWEDAA